MEKEILKHIENNYDRLIEMFTPSSRNAPYSIRSMRDYVVRPYNSELDNRSLLIDANYYCYS